VDEAESIPPQPATRGVRGVGFPSLSLPAALDIMVAAGSQGRSHSLQAMAGYAGHMTANSGPFRQKLAALRDWGFITTTADSVSLTDSGLEAALPTSTTRLLDILLAAFQGCTVFWNIYQEAAKGVPLYPSSIGNVAVTGHGVAAKARETFIQSFIDSAAAVGLAERLPNGEVVLQAIGDPKNKETAPQKLSKNKDNSEMKAAAGSPPAPQSVTEKYDTAADAVGQPRIPEAMPTSPPTGIHQLWSDEHGTITLTVQPTAPLTATAFMQMGEIVTAIEVLRDMLQAGD
jgi:hypothetical protein